MIFLVQAKCYFFQIKTSFSPRKIFNFEFLVHTQYLILTEIFPRTHTHTRVCILVYFIILITCFSFLSPITLYVAISTLLICTVVNLGLFWAKSTNNSFVLIYQFNRLTRSEFVLNCDIDLLHFRIRSRQILSLDLFCTLFKKKKQIIG